KARVLPPERAFRTGAKLATDLWRGVGELRRWPNKFMATHSPARVLHRLYGADAPAVAVGFGLHEYPERIAATTALPWPGALECTTGTVFVTGGRAYRFTLRWRLEERRPILLEILPFPQVLDHKLPPLEKLSRV